MIRAPAVAGYFYPASKESIESTLAEFDVSGVVAEPAMGVVAPHAGYRYSGPVAAKVYASIKAAESVILLGPNHGAGRGFEPPPKAAIMTEGEWEFPTGVVPIDEELAASLVAESPLLSVDPYAHEAEHSLEVQVPFLQRFAGKIKIVPIIISHLSDPEVMELAEGIFRGIKKVGKAVTLVASSDFSHYVPHEVAKRQDSKAIKMIEALDAEGLLKVVREERISMCGYQPTAIVIEVCKKMGAKEGILVDYKTSGDTSGDYSTVVGYGGLIIR